MTKLPASMSGVLLTRHGGPEALESRTDLAGPEPGQVTAAAVNNTDTNTRTGWYGREVTGASGEGTGAQAEFIAKRHAGKLVLIPEGATT